MENVKYIPGDIVMDPFQNREICIVKSVTYDSDGCFTQVVGTTQCALSRFNALIGIPLTKEILEKNGWKKVDEYLNYNMYVKRVSGNTNVCFIYLSKLSNGNWSVCLSTARLANCMYVHQLQHLLFGLELDNNLKI